ncbi:MAG TPA: ABC transporter substrate-binding protein [Stellaceae bacterium]|nr:ABC transporter substrate-binding protein [Stellaceae bacterium]
MTGLTRRTLINRSIGLAAAGTFARPFIANAQAKTAEVWWVQGFVPEEDAAFKAMVADYEKQSSNKIDYSIVPFAPLRQKIVSALTSGVVPDLVPSDPPEIVPEQAWLDRFVDVTDVVETQKSKIMPIGLQSVYCYNNVTKQRAYYGVPFNGAVVPFHIWRTLIEKAGYKESDIPTKWDAFIDFFKPVQKKLQEQGMRHTYAAGFVVSTIGNDPTNTFEQFMFAYGGENIVTKAGKFNGKDPQVHEAVVKAVERLSSLFKDGYIPPSSVNWNDADDNNAFHSKLCVMDFDGTLSTELGMLQSQRDEIKDVITYAPPAKNDGSVMPVGFGVGSMSVPKGAKNIAVAKEFCKYMLQPEINDKLLRGGLGRYLPVQPDLVKDPWWSKDDEHRTVYVEEAFGGRPLIPFYYVYNPAWAQVRTEHPFNIAFHDVTAGGMKSTDAVAKAFKRIDDIFAKYQIKA